MRTTIINEYNQEIVHVESMKDNRSAFNAKEYDDNIMRTIPYYEEIYKQVIDVVAAANKRHLSWLDIGCGTGKMAEQALGVMDIERFVFCDISLEMLEVAKQRFSFPGMEFITLSSQELNYNDEFDIVTAIQVNHYASRAERTAAIKNSYNALKDNGIFITFENFSPESSAGEALYLQRWQNYQMKCGKDYESSKDHVNRYGKDYYPISISEHMEVMKICGFSVVEILWVSYMQVGLLGWKK